MPLSRSGPVRWWPLACALFVVLPAGPSSAQVAYRWVGPASATSGDWAEATRWLPQGVPGTTAGDSVVIDTAARVTLTGAPAHALAGLTLSGGAVLQLKGGGWTLNVREGAGLLSIGGTSPGALVMADDRTEAGITVHATRVVVHDNGAIDADGQGGRGGASTGVAGGGPGGGDALGGGGGHGGMGGGRGVDHQARAYGSVLAPTTFGSGGGSNPGAEGGSGGGRVRLICDWLELTGTLTARGLPPATCAGFGAGGGAGGSVWVTARRIDGDGSVVASGGASDCESGGGGGGRIAIDGYLGELALSMAAAGGFDTNLSLLGGAGTMARTPAGGSARVELDNLSNRSFEEQRPAPTPLGGIRVGDLVLKGNAVVRLGPGERLFLDGELSIPESQAAWIEAWGPARGFPDVGGALSVRARSAVIAGQLKALGSGAGGSNPQVVGPGAGGDLQAGGGGHGGVGGAGVSEDGTQTAAGGGLYGSLSAPVELGSGGGCWGGNCGGAPGGGAVELELTEGLELTGQINVDGATGRGGGAGSGGSIFITAANLRGNGVLSARGGSMGSDFIPKGPGGGGGGTVALFAQSGSVAVDVSGGASASNAGARGQVTRGLRLHAIAPAPEGPGSGYFTWSALADPLPEGARYRLFVDDDWSLGPGTPSALMAETGEPMVTVETREHSAFVPNLPLEAALAWQVIAVGPAGELLAGSRLGRLTVRATGGACAQDAHCGSGFCAQGTCCTTPCAEGDCASGTCLAVPVLDATPPGPPTSVRFGCGCGAAELGPTLLSFFALLGLRQRRPRPRGR